MVFSDIVIKKCYEIDFFISLSRMNANKVKLYTQKLNYYAELAVLYRARLSFAYHGAALQSTFKSIKNHIEFH